MIRGVALAVGASLALLSAQPSERPPIRGLTAAPAVSRAYDLYRYYAAVGPAALRMLRWLLLLPGGDRPGGLLQMTDAREHGQLVRGEADYQLHLIYLWYEKRAGDALALVQGLQAHYPRNPLFHHIEAEIHDVYFHDAAASYAASVRLLALADGRQVHEPGLASVQARLNMATQLDRLGERARAIYLLTGLIAERPARPQGSAARARRLLDELRTTTVNAERRTERRQLATLQVAGSVPGSELTVPFFVLRSP